MSSLSRSRVGNADPLWRTSHRSPFSDTTVGQRVRPLGKPGLLRTLRADSTHRSYSAGEILHGLPLVEFLEMESPCAAPGGVDRPAGRPGKRLAHPGSREQ